MTETYPDMYLTIDDSIYPPIIRLKGRRIGIQHVIMPYWSGQSVAEISHGFAVEETLVQAAIDYATIHPEEVRDIVDEHERIGEEGVAKQKANPSPIVAEVRRRLGRI
ncbi:MAG: hypothetical protein GFH27_549297n303 [Chloroflexi bacterium AL-W]|nr:hypothetical protein [Chloroflexi bacterium AL-N1]NOK68844.1 hypothetical protein [Chloroflexi bacterium AL-N10]NOK76828.1 hypothetical protein [Chloroflexi bacterium AL-N5]NOK82785.1 hypothetical protein [Chloroflexi bacterium AL-W]NOK90685.1 hypothetical protein [Chloroflexi bacterium AL-N15]